MTGSRQEKIIMSNVRKVGAPRGRRPVIWVCSAIINSKLVSEKFTVIDKDTTSSVGSFPKEEAISLFKEKYDSYPETVLGPFYDRKGGKIKTKRINHNTKGIRLTSKQKTAIFGSLRGVANFLENNEKKCYFVPLRSIEQDSNTKSVIPKPGIVNISDLKFVDV
jgi:hypothetical protein